jgi:hypothetical protein
MFGSTIVKQGKYPRNTGKLSLSKKHYSAEAVQAKIRYYKDVPLCENYVRDFFIAAILPVSVKFNAINL